MHITWKRTVIGGDELRRDFCAYVDNIPIARIMRDQDADHRNYWNVNMRVGDALSDSCLTRRDAIEWVEHRFAAFLQTEIGRSDPQEWLQDQRSIELRSMRKNDPAQYAVVVEDLRNGRTERIGRKN